MARLLRSTAYFDPVHLHPQFVVAVAASDAIVRLQAWDAVAVDQVLAQLVRVSRMRRYGRAKSQVLALGEGQGWSQTCWMSDLKAMAESICARSAYRRTFLTYVIEPAHN